MARTHQFTHNDLTIQIHCKTGADELDGDTVAINIYAFIGGKLSPALNNRINSVTRIITQTDSVDGPLGFVLPNSMASAEEHHAAYTALLERDDGLVRKWVRELDRVDAPPATTEAGKTDDPKEPPLS